MMLGEVDGVENVALGVRVSEGVKPAEDRHFFTVRARLCEAGLLAKPIF